MISRITQIRYHGTSFKSSVAFISVRRKRKLVMQISLLTNSTSFGEWNSDFAGLFDIIDIDGDIRIACSSRKVKWQATYVSDSGVCAKDSDGKTTWLRKRATN